MVDEMDEIWALYADDGAQSLDAMEDALENLGEDDSDAEKHIGALFRAVHTFKGNSRVLGLAQVEGMAHLAEDLIGLVRDEGVPYSSEIGEILLQTGDALRGMLDETIDTRNDVDPEPSAGLKDDLRDLIGRLTGAPEPQETAKAKPAVEEKSAPSKAAAPKTKTEAKAETKSNETPPAKAEAQAENPEEVDDKAATEDPSADDAASVPDEGKEEVIAPPAPKAGAPALDTAFFGLLDQLEGGDGADFDDFEEDEDEDEDVTDVSVDEEEISEPAEEPASDAPVLAEVADGKFNTIDPAFRKIFTDMVNEACEKLNAELADWDDAESPAKTKRVVDGLRYAAEQMSLDAWLPMMDSYLELSDPKSSETSDLVAELRVHYDRDLGAPVDGDEDKTPEPGERGASDAPIDEEKISESAEEPEADALDMSEAADGKFNTIDPAFRKIFTDMVNEACEKLNTELADWDVAESPAKAKRVVDGLRYAAEQMSLDAWLPTMDKYLGLSDPKSSETSDLVTELRVHFDRDLGTGGESNENKTPGIADIDSQEASASAEVFFAAMSDIYPVIADIGLRVNSEEQPSQGERQGLTDKINALAKPLGYVRVEDAVLHLAQVEKGDVYRIAELALYEELVSIERTVPISVFNSEVVAPSKLLGAWCADHIFETLTALRNGLDQKTSDDDGQWFPNFEHFMRRVHFACLNYEFETASQLTMVLLDLFCRSRTDGKAPDVILSQMGRGFVQTMELVFDALDQGDIPDTSLIEKMFEDASKVGFSASGLVTARSIEHRLGLPPEFHRVLSPESVGVAHDAIEEGLGFFVLRADLNDDDELAQGFFECITSGIVKMITNVTVFLDHRTLFDFLVASTLTEDGVVEQLALLDPSAERISMTHALTVQVENEDLGDDGSKDSLEIIPQSRSSDNIAMLESVGAISASHALLEHELSQLASVDLIQEISTALREAGVGTLDEKVRSVLRDRLESHSLRLMEISEQGTQLTAELSHLQQESVAQRSLPAEALLRPFKAHVSAQSVKLGREAVVTYVGGEVVLDQLLIEELRQLLKSLVAFRLSGEETPSRFHLSIEAESDHIRVELTDDGPIVAKSEALNAIIEDVTEKKGSLRYVTLPGSAGLRFHLKLPQKMIVLDGMVVRFGKVRYVLPVDAIQRIVQTDQVVSLSAQDGALMLKLDDDKLVPIRSLIPSSAPLIEGTNLFVIVSSGGDRFAIPVDELLGQQLVLLRSLEGVLSSVRDMSGIAILSGGEIGMVVSVSSMVSAHQDAA